MAELDVDSPRACPDTGQSVAYWILRSDWAVAVALVRGFRYLRMVLQKGCREPQILLLRRVVSKGAHRLSRRLVVLVGHLIQIVH